MAIRLKDLKSKTREIPVEYQEETLAVVYRVNVVTPVFLQEMDGTDDKEMTAKQLEAVVERWDLLDEKGKPLRPTMELLMSLPLTFLVAVLNAIVSDMRGPGDEEKKD